MGENEYKVLKREKGDIVEITLEEALEQGLLKITNNSFAKSQNVIPLRNTFAKDHFGNEIFEADFILKGQERYCVVYHPIRAQWGYSILKEFHTFQSDPNIPISVVGNAWIENDKSGIYIFREVFHEEGMMPKIRTYKSNYQIKNKIKHE